MLNGAIFKNFEGLLPKRDLGYYREFVVPTPGIRGAGPQRIISGKNGELFYSPNHYQSFTKMY
ncbi:MAG: ribonuclease domain-containing protein [Anaerolineae bacterium]